MLKTEVRENRLLMVNFTWLIFTLLLAQFAWGSEVYTLNDIQQKSKVYNGSICKSYKNIENDTQEADFRCGQKVTLNLSPQKDQLVLLESPSLAEYGLVKTFNLFRSSFLKSNSQCDETVKAKDDDPSIFETRLCRAFRSEKLSNQNKDVYIFIPNMKPEPLDDTDPLNDAISRALLSGVFVGFPVGAASVDTITLSTSDAQPNKVVIEDTHIDVAFFAKAVTHRKFIFKK